VEGHLHRVRLRCAESPAEPLRRAPRAEPEAAEIGKEQCRFFFFLFFLFFLFFFFHYYYYCHFYFFLFFRLFYAFDLPALPVHIQPLRQRVLLLAR
jgi:hypothetical protein